MRASRVLCGVFSGLLALFSGGVWLNNVYLSWIRHVWTQEDAVAAATIGIFPLFDRICVDHSTVSTFIPFFSLVWLTVAFYRMDRWAKEKKVPIVRKEFPYFSGYSEWMVSLGLMGTVWGLIMIGYLPNLDDLQITDLIGALHTALFSTLIALIWVYIIVLRMIQPFMHWIAARHLTWLPPPEQGDTLEHAIQHLTVRFRRLDDVLGDNIDLLAAFREKITVQNVADLEAFFTSCIDVLPRIEALCARQSDGLDKIRDRLDRLGGPSGDFQAMIGLHREQNEKLDAIIDLLRQKDDRDKRNIDLIAKILKVFKGYGSA